MSDTSKGTGLSKSDLLQELSSFRQGFLGRIHTLTVDHASAEDIFQEACLRFLLSPAVFDYPGAGTRYFSKILDSVIGDLRRRQRWIEYRADLPEAVCEPESDWQRNILLDRIAEAVARLPTRDQHVLSTVFGSDRKLKDKCRSLHLPISTVRYRLQRTIARVRRMVDKKYVHSSA